MRMRLSVVRGSMGALLAFAFCGASVTLRAQPAPAGKVIDVRQYGAKPDDGADDTQAILRANLAARPGDTVKFAPGVYEIADTMLARTKRSYVGDAGAVLHFTQLAKEQYAIAVEANASDVTIAGLAIDGGGIRLTDGSRFSNIAIRGNNISHTQGTPGIFSAIPSDRLIIEENHFHDFEHWGAILWVVDHGSYSHNTFTNIAQGLHMMEPRDDVQVSFNVGTKLKRMGLEIQQRTLDGPPARRLTVEGNVFTDWRVPFYDSFGLSIMPQNGFDTHIVNNYVAASFEGDWGQKDNEGRSRFGYGIEAGMKTGVVEGNTVAGQFWFGIVCSVKNTPVVGNHFYGITKGNEISGEPGPDGFGSAVPKENTIEADMAKLPKPSPTTRPASSPSTLPIP